MSARPRVVVRLAAACCLLAMLILPRLAQAEQAQRRFPTPEFKSGYQIPPIQMSPVWSRAWNVIDVGALVVAIGLGAWFVYGLRSRKAVFGLMVASLLYFGFFRKGCVCPIGAIQNVAETAGTGAALPWVVAAFFGIPILATLFLGRVFCGAACPLGAIQDAVLWKPVTVPSWLEKALGLFPFLYLGLAVILAWFGAQYIICRYDPFVGLFRLSGPRTMLILGGAMLVLGMFVGRPYCRFICPLGAIFRVISPLSWKRVTITPRECIDCRMCENGCPFGAIRRPTAGQKIAGRPRERNILVASMLAVPVLVIGFALLGYAAGPVLARLDWRIKLAELVYVEDPAIHPDAKQNLTDETENFWKSGTSPQALYKEAAELRRTIAVGSSAFGGWTGLVIGLSFVGASIRRYRRDWIADAGTCVACARCYNTCPVEHARRTGRSVDEIMAEKEAVHV